MEWKRGKKGVGFIQGSRSLKEAEDGTAKGFGSTRKRKRQAKYVKHCRKR